MAPHTHKLTIATASRRPRGFTLVEVMVSFVVFAVTILGAMALLMFGLKTVDDAKALNQATQILMNEMESMRMRSWNDQAILRPDKSAGVIHGLKTMGTGLQHNGTWGAPEFRPPGGEILSSKRVKNGASDTYAAAETATTFTPYAIYGITPASGKPVATLGDEIAIPGSIVQLRAATGYTCTREITLSRSPGTVDDVDTASVNLTIAWTDSRGQRHTRSNLGLMSKNGINDYLYRSYPADK